MTSSKSLIKYGEPVIVSRNPEKKHADSKKLVKTNEVARVGSALVDKSNHSSLANQNAAAAGGGGENMEETLNRILPPRQWMEDGHMYVQQVQSVGATRDEVRELSVELSNLLVSRQAREKGICPIRRELYNDVFDEVIRQITIDCVERGLLLLAIRDEISMTTKAYHTLYDSSVAFGSRKAIMADSGKIEYQGEIARLEGEKRELERQFNETKSECDNIEKREQERRAVDEKKRQEEIQFLKRTNQQLKQQVDGISNKSK